MRNDIDLMYTCSLIEYMGRAARRRRSEVVRELGSERLARIYSHAEVLHSDSIDRVADEFMRQAGISAGSYDNVAACRYDVPDYWTIGEVFERLVEDVCEGDVVSTLEEVYGSWISDAISDYNSDLYYQSREYLRECYRAGEVLAV